MLKRNWRVGYKFSERTIDNLHIRVIFCLPSSAHVTFIRLRWYGSYITADVAFPSKIIITCLCYCDVLIFLHQVLILRAHDVCTFSYNTKRSNATLVIKNAEYPPQITLHCVPRQLLIIKLRVIQLLDSDKRFWESMFISISYALIVLVQQWHIIYSLPVEQFTLQCCVKCYFLSRAACT